MIGPFLFKITPQVCLWGWFTRLKVLFWKIVTDGMIPSAEFTLVLLWLGQFKHLVHPLHDHFHHCLSLIGFVLSYLLCVFGCSALRVQSGNGFSLSIYVTIVIKINCIIYALIQSLVSLAIKICMQ